MGEDLQKLLDQLPSEIPWIEKGSRKDYELTLRLRIGKYDDVYSLCYEYNGDRCPCGCGDYYQKSLYEFESKSLTDCVTQCLTELASVTV